MDLKTNQFEEIELPKFVNVKINTDDIDEDTKKALKCLYTREREALPFELPRIMTWPSKERANGERAAIVLKSGFLSLMQNPTSTARVGASSSSKTQSQNTVKDENSDKNSQPRISF